MITNVEIENFRCLKKVSVPLRPLTVLIGPNNSGKSAFLAALNLPQTAVNGESSPPNDCWLGDIAISPVVRVSLSLGTTAAVRRVRRQNGPVGGFGALTPDGVFDWKIDGSLDSLLPTSIFGRSGLTPAMESMGLTEGAGVPTIDNDAALLPAYLDRLLRADRKRFGSLVETLGRLVPGFDDIVIRTPKPDLRLINLRWDNSYVAPASESSVGVRLLLFFVALCFHPTPPRLILIDEPENGIHPKLLQEVVGLLRGLTTGAFGAEPTQVVLTTHSPYLLDYIGLDTDQVLVASINDDGSRSIEPVDQGKLSVFLDEFMLGEVWVNEGEAGMVSSK